MFQIFNHPHPNESSLLVADMPLHVPYKILSVSEVETVFGNRKKMCVQLGDGHFYIVLSERYSSRLSVELMQHLNENCEKYSLVRIGEGVNNIRIVLR